MRHFSVTTEIHASPDRVWAVMSDLQRWPEWTASVVSVEPFGQSRSGVGSRWRVKQPRLAPARFEVTAWSPPDRFEWVAKQPGVTAVAGHVIEPAARGSRVTLTLEFSGPLAGLVGWLYGGLTRRYMQMEADGLKRTAERQDA